MKEYLKLKPEVEKVLFRVTEENVIPTDQEIGLKLRENFTIVCFFEDEDLLPVKTLTDKLKMFDPDQLITDVSQLHVTLLGQINTDSDVADLIATTQEFLNNNSLSFHLYGVGSSKKVASVTAYPVSFDVSSLRKKLRQIGGGTIFDAPYEDLTWINFMRFLNKPKPGLLPALKSEINTEFGIIKPKSVQLLRNSSRLLSNAQVIHTFSI